MIEEGRLKIKWQRCRVHEYLALSRCMKCYSYDHWSEACKGGKICVKCGGNHLAKDCKAAAIQCMNCVKANGKLQLNLDCSHSVLSSECPVYQRRMSMKRRTIMYESI